MRKLAKLLAGTAFMLLLAAGNAMALPTLDSGFTWVNAPFWTPTDATTPPETGNSQFMMLVQDFSGLRDSSFGLFSVADPSKPADPTLFEVFSRAEKPGDPLNKTVSFKGDSNGFSVSLDGTNWTPFSKVFGFYFDFVAPDNPELNQRYYSYFGLDTVADNELNVLTARDAKNSQLEIFLDREGWDHEGAVFQMKILGNDLAPVPEPGTIMLLGAGFLGLAIYGKRRKNA